MPSYSESYSKSFSSVNGNVIEDRVIRKINDNNVKLHILERDKDLIREAEIPLQNNHLFESQKNIAKNLVLQKAMRNFQNIRDSISLQKERNRKLQAIKKCNNLPKYSRKILTVDKYHPMPYIPARRLSYILENKDRLSDLLNTKEQIRRAEIQVNRNKFNKKHLIQKLNNQKKELEKKLNINIKNLEKQIKQLKKKKATKKIAIKKKKPKKKRN